MVGAELPVDARVNALVAVVVVNRIEPVFGLAPRGEAGGGVAETPAHRHDTLREAVGPLGQAHARRRCVGRRTGHDIDDAQKRVAAVGRGVRAAKYLDPLHVVDIDADRGPLDAADEIGRVGRATIHAHQHPPRRVIGQAVIRGQRCRPGLAPDLEARHPVQQLGQVAGPRGADHFAVDDRDRAGGVAQGLDQARGGKDDGDVVENGKFGGEGRVVGVGKAVCAGRKPEQCRSGYFHGGRCRLSCAGVAALPE